jgi:hypothetical protein
MITDDERATITKHAYVPEHLPHYVTAISGTEPHLIGDYVLHRTRARLIFVGYPLIGHFDEAHMLEALDEVKARFEPTRISILAPSLPAALEDCSPSGRDRYYRLNLSTLHIPKKTRNMLKRARREVSVSIGDFSREHKRLIKDFTQAHPLDEATRFIFRRMHKYAKSQDAIVFHAHTSGGDLVAFDVADFGAEEYAFYMFNFRSRKHPVPGASDLLLAYIAVKAKTEGKRYLNLGLGINEGITSFKKKWGGTPFTEYTTCQQESQTGLSWSNLLDRFSRR